ncbi:hypothetical protein [Rhodalgimonas zhirmunskyi]|uniref:Uncharacterized protein n=1 Tax=Rhodalgimonas zhirmunskyi TaxID=2964767 RepID=A0AAJ1UD96_9RHOB|nr:hypothetical protein [Rhodoalgimonas zhirmunskyi]MDQ2095388.1 hypothetical protein [Rhodoalgimonas zhirmunskyi]
MVDYPVFATRFARSGGPRPPVAFASGGLTSACNAKAVARMPVPLATNDEAEAQLRAAMEEMGDV